MRSTICLGLLLASLVTTWASPAAACKCAQRPIQQSYASADDVLPVRVLNRLPAPRGSRRYLALTTAPAYKGCIERYSLVVVETNAESAACGARFELGSQQLLFTTRVGERFGFPVLSTGTCSGNRSLENPGELSDEELSFLSTRSVRCGDSDSCVDSEPVQCLVDPCSTSQCSEAGAVCTPNLCGGCNAEWYTPEGDPVLSCSAPTSTCDDPRRRYVARDQETCNLTDYICEPGSQQFTDSCGCGCFTPDRPAASAPCHYDGCASQLCLGPDSTEPVVTTCIALPEYACLRLTTCEPQADGVCGLTQSPEYTSCVEAARQAPAP